MKRAVAVILSAVIIIGSIGVGNLFVFADDSKTSYSVGDIIEFGSYPQHRVTDSDTILNLNALSTSLSSWVSYNYSNGVQGPSDYMKYIDIEYKGNKYRGVNFSVVRKENDIQQPNKKTLFNLNGYRINRNYWFKY